jgi:predicted nucleic acid-binding protein
MDAPDFLDTNIFVCAYDAANPAKQRIAQEIIRKALSGHAVTSSQALAELATTLLHKIMPKASATQVVAVLDALGPIRLVETDGDTVRRAVEAHGQYGIHFYDGMIVAAAERAGCERILSEDLNAGQQYFGIRVENPFSPPSSKTSTKG